MHNFVKVGEKELWSIKNIDNYVHIYKEEDDRLINPKGFILGGIESNYLVDGNFCITVDFSLNAFPILINPFELNESILGIKTIYGKIFYILRFQLGGHSFIETFHSPIASVIKKENCSISKGQYKIYRLGSRVYGEYSILDSLNFISLGSQSGFIGPVRIMLLAAQGKNSGLRANSSLDISFNNLKIEST